MPQAVQSKETLHRAIEAVQSASTIERAMSALAGALYMQYHVARVNTRMFLGETNEVVVVGAWCSHPSSIVPGLRMRASATSFLDVILEHSVVCGPREGIKELTEDVVYEGVGSWVSVPLPGPFRPDGVLTIASASSALRTAKTFFTDLGDAVGSRLALLGKSSLVYLHAMSAKAV